MPAYQTTSRTQRLCDSLAKALPERPFSLELWDGTRLPGAQPGPTVTIRSPRAVGHLLRAPSQLGLVRAYVDGSLDVDDLDAVVALGGWSPTLSRAAPARLAARAVAATGGRTGLPAVPGAELRPRGPLHSTARDAQSVRHHYDLPEEFFSIFLDTSLTYSCAVFRTGATTLEEAQRAKHELICRKLRLQPGQRVLDVGCGWGTFALHAAAGHGVHVTGITLSSRQAAVAQRRARAAGLDERVDIRVMDYRQLAGETFDAVASVGMIEHVGLSRLDAYARAVTAALKPGGRLLNHGIARLPAVHHRPAAITSRYIFPDGELPRLSVVLAALERTGFEAQHIEDLRSDYARTLRHWTQRLDAGLERAERLVGPERVRVWRLYLRGARNGFEVGLTSVFQVLGTRPA